MALQDALSVEHHVRELKTHVEEFYVLIVTKKHGANLKNNVILFNRKT